MLTSAALRQFARSWLPPAFITLVQSTLDLVRPAPWEYVPDGWRNRVRTRGWNVASVADIQSGKWKAYAESLGCPNPLDLAEERHRYPVDLRVHNTLITFAYVLTLAARSEERISLLDWGGGLGQYYLLSKAVLPDVEIDYYCHDVPLLCQAGRQLLPQAHFLEHREECLSRQYDLVLASSSLWYEEDWPLALNKLVRATRSYLYVTRMIFVQHSASYVAIQRPWSLGYCTEYLCWILNRQEFVEAVTSQAMDLVREFRIGAGPRIHRAPEKGDYAGFLFKKESAHAANRPRKAYTREGVPVFELDGRTRNAEAG